MKHLVLCLLICSASHSDSSDTAVVPAATGPIWGYRTPANPHHYRFLGVPYAEPPTGELRFKDPRRKPRWSEPFNASSFGSPCPQFRGGVASGREDCLFINVFTPGLPDPNGGLPVMTFVHGGGFTFGNGNVDPAPLLRNGVIVVSMNYRLGMLGFMNLDNRLISGNQGLKDQLLAFEWVRDNIQAFGGDKRKVTIFGQSAGGTSVGLHQLSPLGRGLYQRLIMMAGAPLLINGLITSGRSVKDTRRFAADHGCDDDAGYNDLRTLNCLQKLPFERFETVHFLPPNLTAELTAESTGNGMYFCGPSLDPNAERPFLPKPPLEVLIRGEYKDLAIVTGVVENDAALYATLYWQQMAELEADWPAHGFRFLTWESSAQRLIPQDDRKLNAVKDFYFGTKKFSRRNKDEMLDLIDDMVFIAPNIVALGYQATYQRSPVYYYEVNHKPSISFSSIYGRATNSTAVDFGVAHLDDGQFIFDQPFPGIVSRNDLAVRDYMVDMWTNFAKRANPGFNWPPYEPLTHTFMNINATLSIGPQSYEFINRMRFWRYIHWNQIERDIYPY